MGAKDTAELSEPSVEKPIPKSTTSSPARFIGSWPLILRTLSYSSPYTGIIAAAFFFSSLYAVGRNARALLLKPLLDDAIPNADFPLFLTLSAFGVGIIVLMPLALFARAYLTEWVLGKVMLDVRTSLAAKLLRLPLARHHSVNSGETLTRTLLDARAANQVTKIFFSTFMQAGLSVLGGLGTMLLLSWKLTLLSAIGMPLMVAILMHFSGRVRLKAKRQQEQLSDVTTRFSRILSGIKVIKAFRGEEAENKAFAKSVRHLLARRMKVIKQGTLSSSLVELVNSATALGVIFVGGYLVMQETWGLTIGGLGAFVVAAAMTYAPIKKISTNWPKLTEALASVERFFEILDEEEEPADRPNARRAESLRSTIEFDRVSFSYSDDETPVLHDISFRAECGEIVAIVGPTGSGKTTLADLLVRFYDPDSGAIEFDGVDLRDLQRKSFLDQVAVVTQEPFLFDATLRENIRYGRLDSNNDDFENAVRIAHVDEFVETLPNGYDTEVLEGGIRLSGGQRQRITIARAILRNPSLLIFDEATSALDAKTERTVQDALDALRGQLTIFVIAHRLSTVRHADRILVLDQGRIVAQGSHVELMKQTGLYRELVELQAETEIPHRANRP